MKIKLLIGIYFFTSICLYSCKKNEFVELKNNEPYLVEDKLVLLTKRDLKIEGNGYLKFQDEKWLKQLHQ